MPERRWVINASPLILLGKIGRLDLLRPLTTVVRIPRGVKREVECGDPADPARCWIASVPEDSLVDCSFTDLTIAGWNLGRGETEVLSFARSNPQFTAVIDMTSRPVNARYRSACRFKGHWACCCSPRSMAWCSSCVLRWTIFKPTTCASVPS